MYRGKAVTGGSEVNFEISLVNNDTDDIYRLNASVPVDWKYYVTNKEGDEITEVLGRKIAPTGAKFWSPAFDITPHELVSAYITDPGLRPGGRS